MRSVGYAAFAVLALVLAAIFAVGIYGTVTNEDQDTPEQAARKAECRKLARHNFELSGVPAAQLDEAVAKVPIEDIEQCGAALPESTACMVAATTIDALHACVPATIECKNGQAEVTGKHPVNEVVGECKTVKVTGSNIAVIAKAIDTLEIDGNDNSLRVGVTKTLNDKGQRNKITR